MCTGNTYCVNTVGSHICQCKPNWGGALCDQQVTHVYGAKLTFLALAEQEQGWTVDLLDPASDYFQRLAGKVQETVSITMNVFKCV